jgi:8-oxo-dGTP pyrophosphatase MutT (NUDIX family)
MFAAPPRAVFLSLLRAANALGADATCDPNSVDRAGAFTTELCAGIVDKSKSLEEIACEEILEECGYNVRPQGAKCRPSCFFFAAFVVCPCMTSHLGHSPPNSRFRFVAFIVDRADLLFVNEHLNGVGTNGSKQTVYYAEVSDKNLAPGAGGGLRDHGEYIDVIYLPVDKARVRESHH